MHAAFNPPTSAVVAVATDSVSVSSQGGMQLDPSGKDSGLPNRSQPSSRGARMLELLVTRQFQPDVVGIQHADGNASLPTSTLVVPQPPNQKVPNPDNPPVSEKELAKSSSITPLASPAPDRQSASTDAQLVMASANRSVHAPGNLLSVLRSLTKEELEPAEASALIRQASNAPTQSPATMQDQSSAQSSPANQLFEMQDNHLQRALDEMENLQLNFFSVATAQGGTPLPSGLETAKAFISHSANQQLPVASAGDLRQKQAAADPQNSGKGTGGPDASATQEGANLLSQSPAAAGSSSNSSNDGKPGQNSSARHCEISGVPSSGASSASSSFNSVAASATAASANGFPAAPSQVASTNSASANAGPWLQSSASHAAVADKSTAAIENPLNPMGGVVNAASMLQAQGKTEMRVALETESLGPLELHAVLDGGQVGASIAVVNHEAHTILTNNLPALQQTLADQNLRLDHLSILNAPMSSGTNTGNGGSFHSGGHTQSRPNAPRWAFPPSIQVVPGSKDRSDAEALQGRLSVHA